MLVNDELVAAMETDQELWSNRLRITELWVKEKYQKLGIGHALIGIAKEQARRERRRAIILETQSCNVNAVDFYQHEGFSLIGMDTCCYKNNDLQRKEVRLELGWFPEEKKRLNDEEIEVRMETRPDWYNVELMTQHAFWNKHHLGCDEHYLVHKLRQDKDYLPELSRMIGKEAIKAVDGVTFSLDKNETLAIVGESGSGKSATVLSIMGLIKSPGKIVSGEILLNDKNLLDLTEKQMAKIRGNRISMVYQEPMTSLNPAISVGEQIREAIVIHKSFSKKESKERAIKLMMDVCIPEAGLRYNDFPGKFSGGMRQRIMIAMAIACAPDVLIADEPPTALDVTIQAEIMELLRSMKKDLKMSMLLITHDLGIVAENADRVLVMYCGKVMEEASVEEMFRNPKHPYTVGFMKCIPSIEVKAEKLTSIPGYVPHPSEYPNGCRFSNRCTKAMDICSRKLPELIEIEAGHKIACWWSPS